MHSAFLKNVRCERLVRGLRSLQPGRAGLHDHMACRSVRLSTADRYATFRIPTCLLVEVGIEHAHARDAIDRLVVAVGGVTNRLRRRSVVDTEGVLLILGDVRM